MYESGKKSDKKPKKIYLKNTFNSIKKINNFKNEEKQVKENPVENNISSDINNNKIIHESMLKEIEKLEKELKEIEKENELILEKKSILLEDNKKLLEKYDIIKEDIEYENEELEELKNINDEKNREYLQLNHLRHQHQMSNDNSNNSERNNQENNTNDNNNNENDRFNDILNGFNFLLNLSRLRRINEEDGDNGSINSMSNNNDEENNEEGPPMTNEQLQNLPSSIYPRNNSSNEKCTICQFDFCYKDTITKLKCNHTFHKECLINRLSARHSSKCPTCKASII